MITTLITLFLTSVAFLTYEILLMKILSIEGWSHYAYMVVSLSMLGMGFSGVMLGLFPDFFRKNRYRIISAGGFIFSILLPVVFYINRRLPINYLYLIWEWRQMFYMILSYFLYGLPFLIISTMLVVFFLMHPKKSGQVYAVNLLGSGTGVLGGLLIMHLLPPGMYILVCSVFAALASLCWMVKHGGEKRKLLSFAAFSAAILLNIGLLPSSLVPYMSEYKGLPSVLRLPGVEITDKNYSPYGILHILEGDAIRLTSAQSLTYMAEMPEQKALTFDGDAPSPVFNPEKIDFNYLQNLMYAAPYELKEKPRVLLAGAGGLESAVLAAGYDSSLIRAVEINPGVIEILRKNMMGNFDRWTEKKGVDIVTADARSYIEKSGEAYDIIQMDPAGTMASSTSGLYAQNEDYLNTVEGFGLFLERLSQDGMFMVSRWMNTPARDGIKLFSTAVAALESIGVERPQDKLMMIRNWDVVTLIMKRKPFTDSEISAIRDFCSENRFDLSYYPGISEGEVNRYHVLPEEEYYNSALKILDTDKREAFFENYLFNVRPATDDKPYFSHFFRWAAMPHLIQTLGREWIPFAEYGYLILLATFAQSAAVGFLFIIIPLIILIRRSKKSKKESFKFNSWVYFIFLGIAFMVLEIALIQKFILFLHNPVYSAAIVIGAFLTVSGAGSMFSRKLSGKSMRYQLLPFILIIALSVLYSFILDPLFAALSGANIYLKFLLSFVIISPLAFLLGMPFPMGMNKVAPAGEVYTGSAWGYNGFFSVTGSVLTPILAMMMGIQRVILIGGLFYAGAMLMWKLKFK